MRKHWHPGPSKEEMAVMLVEARQMALRRKWGSAYEEVGSLLLNLGDPEAERWLRMALEDYQRQDGGRASVRCALTLWKLGDVGGCESECRRVCAQSIDRVAASGGEPRELAGAYFHAAPAHFIQREYSLAVDAARKYLAADEELGRRAGVRPSLTCATAVRDMATGIIVQDRKGFDLGLDVLADGFDSWPSAASSWEQDLFRFALSLPICDAEAFIRWKMEGDAHGVH